MPLAMQHETVGRSIATRDAFYAQNASDSVSAAGSPRIPLGELTTFLQSRPANPLEKGYT